MKINFFSILFSFNIIFTNILATEIDSSFIVQWQDSTWGEGGLFPAGPAWNMVGPYDFDNDGFGDFVVSSSYAGQYCNGVYHYEAVNDDSIAVKWVYTFYDLSCAYDAYSSVAVGNIDGDSYPEILSLVDTSPGVTGQRGLQIFEWSPDSMSFLSAPTFTWDMGLDSVWEAGQIFVEDLDGDNKEEIIVSVMDGPWEEIGSGGSSRLMIFELDTVVNDSAIFNIEYEDNSWTNWSGYNISTGDLDNDGLMEIYTVAYEYYHVIVYENTEEDQYEYQTDFYVSSELYERGNQGILIHDINNDGANELFVLTSGTNTLAGTLLAPGKFYVAGNIDDVSALSFADFNYFASYSGGLRQVINGDADGDGNPNLYLAGHYNESLYDWEYNGGDPLLIENYTERIVFMDDTTDNYTPGNDQGKVRVAKLFTGDIDNDNKNDIIFSSASFAPDKPHLFMIEHDGTLGLGNERNLAPQRISIGQNYPNPFNPETRFQYTTSQANQVSLVVYDILGNEVRTIYDGFKNAGTYHERWQGTGKNNQIVASGIYFFQLKVGENRITKKMVFGK